MVRVVRTRLCLLWVYFITVTAHFWRLPFLLLWAVEKPVGFADRFSYRPMLADVLQPLCIGL